MKVTPQRPKETGREYALRILEDNIIHLNLPPGSMVSENELSAQLGLSRTPVREALIKLSKVDIVQIVPQRGSQISYIDPSLVEQAYFMRSTLECEALGIAIDALTEADIFALASCIAEQKHFCQTGGEGTDVSFMSLDNQFHEKIFAIAQKPMVYRIIQELAIHFDRIRHMAIHYMTPPEILAQHEAIYEAMKARDKEKAVETMRIHLGKFKDIEAELRKTYPDYFLK